jgi:hypothetical protein
MPSNDPHHGEWSEARLDRLARAMFPIVFGRPAPAPRQPATVGLATVSEHRGTGRPTPSCASSAVIAATAATGQAACSILNNADTITVSSAADHPIRSQCPRC